METNHVPVLVVGAGPVGLTLANLLGEYGIHTLLVEANGTTSDLPKAILIDDESFRTFQAFGFAERIREAVVYGTGARYYSRHGKLLAKVPPIIGGYGYAKRSALDQPPLERFLMEGLDRYDSVETRFNTRLVGLESSEAGEIATLEGPEGIYKVAAQWIVGCDGGRSSVREISNIRMVGASFREQWVIVDVSNDPDDSRYTKFFCNPRRPTVSVPAPRRGRRYEFMLFPDEQPEEMLEAASITSLTAPYRSLEQQDIVRKTVYTFHAINAEKYRLGRRLLAGDAAHMMPPFAGQGMNSGIRDAHNLAWKLALCVAGRAGPELLDTYQTERRSHVQAMIDLSVRLGRVVMPTSTFKATLRDAFFHALSLVPSIKLWIASMRWKPAPSYKAGCFVGSDGSLAGTMIPQPDVVTGDSQSALLDDIIGPGFALICEDEGPLEALSHPLWDNLNATRVRVLTDDRTPHEPGAVGDRSGALAECFKKVPGQIILVRPDRYVAGTFRLEGENEFAEEFQRLIGE